MQQTQKFIQKLNQTSTTFVRSIFDEINWDAQLIGIKGARGIGKTTLLLQYIKLNLSNEIQNTLLKLVENLKIKSKSQV